MFHCILRINDKIYGSGVGRTKKEAEQNAAQKAMEELGKTHGTKDIDDDISENDE
jgi:dsRNA-specific ribonuclease